MDRLIRLLAAPLLFCGLCLPVRAQPVVPGPDSVVVVANAGYLRSGLHRFFLGEHYRDLWGTPVRAELLDLDRWVTIEPTTGYRQAALRLKAADGTTMIFRSLVSPADVALPPALLASLVDRAVDDQRSAGYPGSALVVAHLLEAAGWPQAQHPVLRVMPDQPLLGASRAEFGGRLGLLTVEENAAIHPTALDVGTSEDLIRALWQDPAPRPDPKEYLTHRLMDLYLGVWDRPDDRRWALVPESGGSRWLQLPINRDQAFSRFDGLLYGLGGLDGQTPPTFGPRYQPPESMNWTERQLDRRLLSSLDHADWVSVIELLQGRLTDSVIDQALASLPPEYRAADGGVLRAALVARRESIESIGNDFYRFLALEPDLEGTNGDDVVTVEVGDGGATRVVMRRQEVAEPFFTRTFHPGETDEIRIYLRDGNDKALITGSDKGPLVRVIGDPGHDTLIDASTLRHSRFYDAAPPQTVAIGGGVDRRNYQRPGRTDPGEALDQDWGSQRTVAPRLQLSSEVGLALGVQIQRRSFGFRRQPYANQATGLIDFSFDRKSARLSGDVRRKLIDRDGYFSFSVLASGLEGLRWFGEGNGTTAAEADDFYRVRQRVFELSYGIGLGLEGPYQLHMLLKGRHTETDGGEPINRDGLIGQVQPKGYGSFGQLGLQLRGEVNTRDHDLAATRGVFARVIVEGNPLTSGSGGSFGRVSFEGATYFTPGLQTRLTMAIRAGGQAAFGDYPYFAAATVGGRRTLAGFHRGRFNGDQAVSGSYEARYVLFRPGVLVPTDFGIGLRGDIGRVFSGQDLDQEWRSSIGASLYLSVPSRSLVVLAGAAFGGEGTRIVVGLGQSY